MSPPPITISTRERWAARSMVVSRWPSNGQFRSEEPVCELETDGVPSTLLARWLHPEDIGTFRRYFVREGRDVGPWGMLAEYTIHAPLLAHPRRVPIHRSANTRLVRRQSYPRIFMNYRRDDADASAGRLHETLVRTFGRDEVFMDQFSIRPGEVFPWTIQQAVVNAKVVVSLIGPKWGDIRDAYGRPRLENSTDYVRRELVAALDRGTPILPVLLPGGVLPDPAAIKVDGELDGLQDVQFLQLSPRHWEADVDELLVAVKERLEMDND